MAKVVLSKKIREILKDRSAREQLDQALETSATKATAQTGTVSIGNKTYRVVVGPRKKVAAR